mgnify:CR=1 FL=1
MYQRYNLHWPIFTHICQTNKKYVLRLFEYIYFYIVWYK